MKHTITLTINGASVTEEVDSRLLLVHFIREQLDLTGTHIGCDTSNCGACTILLDGKSVKSCTYLAVRADGAEITTIEGLAPDGTNHPLQQAFHDQHGLHCGFCTPGMIMRSVDLLKNNPNPTEEEIRWGISGNLCRCTGYNNIVKAVKQAADELQKRIRLIANKKIMFKCKTSPEVGGMGHSVKRKEDARFLHGKGNYVDDVKLPGMLTMVMVRSPYAYAKIKSINKEKALAIDGVLAVITGEDLAQYNLHWMPTLLSDTQMVLPTDTVMHQSQEVAAVIATDRYIAVDGAEAVEVDYEVMDAIVDPFKALDDDAPLLRPDKEGQKDNHIYHWERGDRAKTDDVIAKADVVVKERIYLPRIHVASIETCGCVASYDKDTQKLTVYLTTQAPHAIRTVVALVAGHVGLSEEKIRIISPDIGGGFGGKVPVYPSYVVAIAATFLIGKPVKWIEDRSENLVNGFARDYHMDCELAATKDGKIQAFKVKTLADHGYTDSSANPSKYPTGMFSICTGSYDYEHAFAELDAVYTNKAPGGVAYRCSFRVTEAVHAIERMVDKLAAEIGKDPAMLRLENFIKKEQFPYASPLGWSYDSGDYHATLKKAMDMLGYDDYKKEQAEKRKQGKLMGIGLCTFTEVVGAGPSKDFDILGIAMFDSAEIRVHPTGKAMARFGTKSQGQGHETTYAQILAEELGIPYTDIEIEEGDTDTAPYGLGTYASRSTPTAGAAAAIAARKLRDKGKKIAAYLLEVSEEDIEWEVGKYFVKGAPEKSKTIQDVAFAAYTNIPPGMEPGFETTHYYDPPNLTFPNGAYICVVEVDQATGAIDVKRFVAIDDCGNIINPMIVEGQVHGGLTRGIAPAMYEGIEYDAQGNVLNGTLMDYLVPTAVESPHWETGHTITPSPHHPLGAKGVAESPTVGAPPAIANAIIDALAPLGIKHLDIPITPAKVWEAIQAHS